MNEPSVTTNSSRLTKPETVIMIIMWSYSYIRRGIMTALVFTTSGMFVLTVLSVFYYRSEEEVTGLPWAVMGDIEGSYRVLQTPGKRLGGQFNAGISTLEPGQSLSGNISGNQNHGRRLQIRVQGLDDSQEFFDVDVSHFWNPQYVFHIFTFCAWSGFKLFTQCCIACVWLGVGWWQLPHGFGAENPFLIKASYSGNFV